MPIEAVVRAELTTALGGALRDRVKRYRRSIGLTFPYVYSLQPCTFGETVPTISAIKDLHGLKEFLDRFTIVRPRYWRSAGFPACSFTRGSRRARRARRATRYRPSSRLAIDRRIPLPFRFLPFCSFRAEKRQTRRVRPAASSRGTSGRADSSARKPTTMTGQTRL